MAIAPRNAAKTRLKGYSCDFEKESMEFGALMFKALLLAFLAAFRNHGHLPRSKSLFLKI